jgi:hypothetical protein
MAAVEIWCKTCGHYDEDIGRPIASDEKCPQCDAGVHRRVGRRIEPFRHFDELFRAIFSLNGIIFLAVFALFGSLPIGIAQRIAIVLLTLASLKFAVHAMQVTRDKGVTFPELSLDDLFDLRALLPSILFTILFVWVPPFLVLVGLGLTVYEMSSPLPTADMGMEVMDEELAKMEQAQWEAMQQQWLDDGSYGAPPPPPKDPALAAALEETGYDEATDDGEEEQLQRHAGEVEPQASGGVSLGGVGLMALALLLLLWAPMALVVYLRSGSTFGLFWLPAGIGIGRRDPRGYASLAVLVIGSIGAQVAANALIGALPFFIAPPIVAAKAVVVLLTWGLCGLYIRSNARLLNFPVDEDDWEPNVSMTVTMSQGGVVHAESDSANPGFILTTPSPAPQELDDEPPLLTGTVLPLEEPPGQPAAPPDPFAAAPPDPFAGAQAAPAPDPFAGAQAAPAPDPFAGAQAVDGIDFGGEPEGPALELDLSRGGSAPPAPIDPATGMPEDGGDGTG